MSPWTHLFLSIFVVMAAAGTAFVIKEFVMHCLDREEEIAKRMKSK